MANETNNRVSHTMTNQELNDVLNTLNQVGHKLNFTRGLEPGKNLLSMHDENKIFVQDAIKILDQRPDLFPRYLDSSEIEKDLTLFEQLDKVLLLLNEIVARVSVTKAIVADEAYGSSLTVYRLLDSARKAGIEGTSSLHKRMAERFKNQGKKTNVTQNDEDDTTNSNNQS